GSGFAGVLSLAPGFSRVLECTSEYMARFLSLTQELRMWEPTLRIRRSTIGNGVLRKSGDCWSKNTACNGTRMKTVETALRLASAFTRLKPGANESGIWRSKCRRAPGASKFSCSLERLK